MRHKITIILLSLLTQFSYGQDGLIGKKYFILQKSDDSISINSYDDNKINELCAYQLPDSSIYETDGLEKLVILDIKRKKIEIHDFIRNKTTTEKIPFKIKPLTLFLDKNNLFVGGEVGQEVLIQHNFKTGTWFTLDIPTDVLFPGKAIDDIVVANDTIYAVDNIVLPKYILTYLNNDSAKCDYLRKIDLKANGPYESIRQARITSDFFGLISDTYSGYSGAAYHITIYDKVDFQKSFAITVESKYMYSLSDFVITENKLIILSREKGIGTFTIKPNYFKEIDEYNNTRFNVTIKDTKINFKKYENEILIKLTLIPQSDKVILTKKIKNGNYKNNIIE
jgi:hypothetical protein